MTTKEKTVTAPTLEQLEQAEQEAMAKVAEARRARDRLQRERENRRAAALEEYDRQVLAGWNEDRRRLETEAGAAREAFRAALLADPTWNAYGLRATARVQRRGLAGRALQRLPGRPGRIPQHRASPAPPRRADRLHQPADHRHPGPSRQPTRRPRPRAPHPGTQRHPRPPTRRPPTADLSGQRGMSFNDDHSRTCGGLRLRRQACPCGPELPAT